MNDAVPGAPVRQDTDQLSAIEFTLTLQLGQQCDANSGLCRLNEDREVAGRDLRLDRDGGLLPPRAR